MAWYLQQQEEYLDREQGTLEEVDDNHVAELKVMQVQIPQGTLAALQHNAAMPKDFTQVVPKPVVIVVNINSHPA